MTNLIEFFETLTGLTIPESPIFTALIVLFGFIIVYDVIHIVFGSVFQFICKF